MSGQNTLDGEDRADLPDWLTGDLPVWLWRECVRDELNDLPNEVMCRYTWVTRQQIMLHRPTEDGCSSCGEVFPCLTLRLHATTYAYRAGYRPEEWAVSKDERGESQVVRYRTYARIWDFTAGRERIVPIEQLPGER